MKHAKYPAKLPTRTTLRRTASRARAAALGRVRTAAVVIPATAAFAAGTVVVGFALAVVMATVSAHPVALLATA